MLEVPEPLTAAALQLLDALAARFVSEDLPHAGVPFEAGTEVALALVPAAEAAETVAPEVAGSPADRVRFGSSPRAAVCAAGQRGSFRRIWPTPIDALERLMRHDAGLCLSMRVVEVRERLARATWNDFAAAHARHSAQPTAVFLAKVARPRNGEGPGEREHVWIAVAKASDTGGDGSSSHTGPVSFALTDVGDWRVVGVFAGEESIGPDRADRLR